MPRIEQPRLDSPRFKANPYPIYARLRAESPVYRTKVAFWLPAIWVITRYADVVSVLKDQRFSKDYVQKYPWLPRFIRAMYRNLITVDPPDHTRLRALVQKAFTPRMIEDLRGRIQRLCDELLDRAGGSDTIELMQAYALPVPLTIIADLLGVPVQDRPRFEPWTKKVAAAGSSASLGDFLRALPAIVSLGRYVRRLIALRRAAPQEDLITALVRAEESGNRLTQDEIVSMVLLLLIAGYETTVHLIATGALTLMQHPEQGRRLQASPALAASAVEEILRYTSPVEFATPRLTLEEITIGSVTIPRGELVVASLGSANHDESQFPDPETFDIAREPNKQVSFGMGSHFCLGAALARLETEIALTTLFRRLPSLHLAVPADALRWRKSLAMRGVTELPVRTGGRDFPPTDRNGSSPKSH
jgi:cytochrome P450